MPIIEGAGKAGVGLGVGRRRLSVGLYNFATDGGAVGDITLSIVSAGGSVAITSTAGALRDGLAGDAPHRFGQALTVLPHHRKHGPGLNRNLEHLGFFTREVQQRGRQDEVPRGRDRQELGEPFHHAHDGGFD